MRRIIYFTAAVAIATATACGDRANDSVIGDNSTGTNPAGESSIGTSGADMRDGDIRQFVEDMAHAGMAEVELGRMASERGSNAAVKAFGQMMVTDHSKANDELKNAASRSSIQVPAGMDEQHRDLADRLSNMSGAEFDREYITAMVDGHEDVADKLERHSRMTGNSPQDNAAISEWASNALPTVQRHLERARQIQGQLASSGAP